jgi:heme oxygenase
VRTGRAIRSEFAARLRTSTADDFERVRAQPFLRALINGELDVSAHANLLAQHHFVYEALEAAGDFMRSDIVAGPFVSERLRRLPALRADLQFFFGADWERVISPGPAAERYRDRINEICFDWPGGFVAHHYVRYLADLSGGQAVRAALTRASGQPPTEGVASLTFRDIPNVESFRGAYRTLLDTAGWKAAEQKRIIAEVRYAYWLNAQLLAELGERSPLRIPAQRGGRAFSDTDGKS